jgi:putative oxidoreductase
VDTKVNAVSYQMMIASSNSSSPSWLPKLLSIVRIAVGLLFLEHGLSTAFGFATGRPDHNFARLHAWAGPIETTGAILLILGLFTRTTGFILAGEMAVAYFQSPLRWAGPPGFVLLPLPNAGEEAALNCFFFLWLVTAGGGAWSLDALIAKRRRKAADSGVGAMREPVRT